VLSHFWAPLCAVGSHGERGPNAQICVSVFGASIVPEQPRLLVVLSNTNYTTELVREAGSLAVTVLSEAQLHLLEPLGLHSGRERDKLAGLEVELTGAGDPVLSGGAGSLACEVLERFDLGDSTAFLAAVLDRTESHAPPLSWQAARTVVGQDFLERWAQKSAREQAAARATMKWVE
jgi:flavin reductase (DIM6/NTAB) family NADH-FMN oxidoreductase RutF